MTLTLIEGGLKRAAEAANRLLGNNTGGKRMEAPKQEEMIVRYIPISTEFKGMKFDSFDTLRVESNKLVNSVRNEWVNACLMRNGIVFNSRKKMTKREMIDIFESNNITLDRETGNKKDFDVMRQGDRVIGRWNNDRQIHFGEKTEKLYVKVEYIVY